MRNRIQPTSRMVNAVTEAMELMLIADKPMSQVIEEMKEHNMFQNEDLRIYINYIYAMMRSGGWHRNTKGGPTVYFTEEHINTKNAFNIAKAVINFANEFPYTQGPPEGKTWGQLRKEYDLLPKLEDAVIIKQYVKSEEAEQETSIDTGGGRKQFTSHHRKNAAEEPETRPVARRTTTKTKSRGLLWWMYKETEVTTEEY